MAITYADILRYNEKYERRGPNDCWPWTASLNKYGYGQFRRRLKGADKSTVTTAHRFGWEMWTGQEIPAGMELDHRADICGNHRCQNPAHLEVVTKSENVRRGNQWRKKRRLALAA